MMRRGVQCLVLLALLYYSAQALIGQGCSQCRDTVVQTNPAVQSSYRVAIMVMIAAASGLSIAAALVFRKMQ